jgi:hypothetical protein
MRMSEVGPSLSSPTSAGRGSRQRISKDAKSRACLVCQSARSRSTWRTLGLPPQTGPANSERRTRCPQAPIDGSSRLTSRLHQIAPPPRGRSKAVNLARAAAAARAFYARPPRCHSAYDYRGSRLRRLDDRCVRRNIERLGHGVAGVSSRYRISNRRNPGPPQGSTCSASLPCERHRNCPGNSFCMCMVASALGRARLQTTSKGWSAKNDPRGATRIAAPLPKDPMP